jgi:hypothetical protein
MGTQKWSQILIGKSEEKRFYRTRKVCPGVKVDMEIDLGDVEV